MHIQHLTANNWLTASKAKGTSLLRSPVKRSLVRAIECAKRLDILTFFDLLPSLDWLNLGKIYGKNIGHLYLWPKTMVSHRFLLFIQSTVTVKKTCHTRIYQGSAHPADSPLIGGFNGGKNQWSIAPLKMLIFRMVHSQA